MNELKKNEEPLEILDNPYIIKFSKPYHFEGKEYTELNIKEIENVTTEQSIEIQRMAEQQGYTSLMNATIPEVSSGYACCLCSLICHLPIEFFKNLPIKDAIKIRTRVTNFLFGETLS